MQYAGQLLLAVIILSLLFAAFCLFTVYFFKWWKKSKTTGLKFAAVFAFGFLMGPIVVVESFGSYTAYRIHQQDLANSSASQSFAQTLWRDEEFKETKKKQQGIFPDPK